MARAAGVEVTGGSRASGGSINEAWALELAGGGRAFVKTRADAAPGEYATEAAGLRWLAQAEAVALPGVLARRRAATGRASWRSSGSTRAAWTPPARRRSGAGWPRCTPPERPTSARRRRARSAGRARSRRCASASSRCPTSPAADWPSFYAQRRLAPLVALCLERGTLSASGARAVERVCERIGDLAGPAEPPARLHGDLWGGNVLAGADGRARLIDPAAYGGHREVDLAMLRLFGAPSERVFAAYDEAAPLADGHRERVGALAALPAARARRAVRRLLRRVGRARGRALRHVTAA